MRHRPIGPVLAALLLLAPATAPAQEQTGPERVDVAGLVTDATTGEPLAAAAISIRGTRIRALTNQDGRFLLRRVPGGEQVWVVERLGYATWEQPFTARHLDQLRIGLMARPVALEEIRVTVDRLEARRKLAGYSVHTADRESLRTAVAVDAAELVRSRVPWIPTGCPSRVPRGVLPSGPAAVTGGDVLIPNESSLEDPGQRPTWLPELCVRYRGGVLQPSLCLDDRPIAYVFLAAYNAEEIYAVDYVGGPRPQIRVYTERFLESRRPIRPFSFGCG